MDPRGRRLLRSALLPAALALIAAFPIRCRAADEGLRVEGIEFAGNAGIGEGAIRRVMKIRQPIWWNPFRQTPYLGPDYLALDLYRILDLYRGRGYPFAVIRGADVEVQPGEEKVRIRIRIEEGPRKRIDRIALDGIQVALEPRAREVLGLETGELLSITKIDAARGRLARFYGEAGYLGAVIYSDRIFRGDSTILILRVEEGSLYRLRDVVIDSTLGQLVRTAPEVIHREVALKPGEIFRTSRLVKSRERIYDTGVFRTVRVVPRFDSLATGLADLHVTVHERHAGYYGFGAGFSSDDRIRLIADWGNRNLSGRARQLKGEAGVSFSLDPNLRARGIPVKAAHGTVSYLEPWLLGTRTRSTIKLNHTYERQNDFDQDITALDGGVRRDLGRFSRIGLGLTNKWVRTGDPEAAGGTYVTRNLSAELEEDRRDDILDPRRGSHTQLLGEFAGGLIGGRTEFTRWTATSAWYFGIPWRGVLALRARAGWIIPVGEGVREEGDSLKVSRIPFEERFRLGGGTTVRGYKESSLGRRRSSGTAIGGTALLLSNAEVRFPIVSVVGGAVFLDAGNVWADPAEIRWESFTHGWSGDRHNPLDVAYGIGVGLRIQTPVGPFRIDYGTKVGSGRAPGDKRSELHLSLGQAF